MAILQGLSMQIDGKDLVFMGYQVSKEKLIVIKTIC